MGGLQRCTRIEVGVGKNGSGGIKSDFKMYGLAFLIQFHGDT